MAFQRKYQHWRAWCVLEMPQPKLSNLLRSQFRGFSERRLMDCLSKSVGRFPQLLRGEVGVAFSAANVDELCDDLRNPIGHAA